MYAKLATQLMNRMSQYVALLFGSFSFDGASAERLDKNDNQKQIGEISQITQRVLTSN